MKGKMTSKDFSIYKNPSQKLNDIRQKQISNHSSKTQ